MVTHRRLFSQFKKVVAHSHEKIIETSVRYWPLGLQEYNEVSLQQNLFQLARKPLKGFWTD